MSYILEAIRRSDEERRKRLVPNVSTIHTASPPRPGLGSTQAAGMILVACVALLVAVVIGARVWVGTGPTTQAAPETVALAEPEDGSSVADQDARAAEPEADADSALPISPAASAPLRPVDAPEPTAAAPEPSEAAPSTAKAAPRAAKAARNAEKKPDSGRPRTPYSAVTAAAPKHQPAALDPRVPPPPTVPANADTELPAAPPAPQPPAGDIVSAMALIDLPDPVRRSLPDIAITLHRYADNPAARMIRVNGRVGREGEAVAEDLSIAEITRTGVVFAIGEERFYMDAFQNWQAKNGS